MGRGRGRGRTGPLTPWVLPFCLFGAFPGDSTPFPPDSGGGIQILKMGKTRHCVLLIGEFWWTFYTCNNSVGLWGWTSACMPFYLFLFHHFALA